MAKGMARRRLGKVLMRLKKWLILGMASLVVGGAGLLYGLPQQEGGQQTSLGDLARQLKSSREKTAKKPAKVFTNDNLPARPAKGSLTVAAQISPTEESEAEQTEAATTAAETAEPTGEEASTEAAPPEPGEESAEAHDETYYRERMRALQSRLELHQRQLSVLEQKRSQGQMQFYGDPNKTLQQESTPAFYSDTNKLRDDIEQKKKDIAADQQAIEDLRDQLRREGAPAGWLR